MPNTFLAALANVVFLTGMCEWHIAGRYRGTLKDMRHDAFETLNTVFQDNQVGKGYAFPSHPLPVDLSTIQFSELR